MLGALLMIVVLLVVMPIGVLMAGAALAGIFSQSFSNAKERDYEGSELLDLEQ